MVVVGHGLIGGGQSVGYLVLVDWWRQWLVVE
jgi:hypothetical protein